MIVKANKEAAIVDSLTVKTTSGGISVKLTPKRVFGKLGVVDAYLTYREVISSDDSKAELKDGDSVLQYWVTPDKVFVTGTASREYSGIANKTSIKTASETAPTSTVKNFDA